MNFLNKMEHKVGKYAIPNLINYILIGYGIGYLLQLFSASSYQLLYLDPQLIMEGQVWRLFTWIITVPEPLNFFTIFMFLFYYWIGHSLENHWGTFRYNLYMLSGYLIMTIGAMLIYGITWLNSGGTFAVSLSMSTYYINMASFLAAATVFGDMQIYFMMLIPIKMKWLAIVDAIYLGYECIYYIGQYIQLRNQYASLPTEFQVQIANSTLSYSAAIILSVLNFLIFFFATRNYKKYSPQEIRRKHTYHKQVLKTQGISKHKCAICGRTSESNPELTFRFCSKCDGNYEYCEEHIYTHEHVKKQ